MSEEWRNELVTKGTAYDALANLDQYAELGECLEAIKGLPHAQHEKRTEKRTEMHACDFAQPQRKMGKWIVLDECSNEGVYCSECHKKVLKIDYSNTMKCKNFKFCPTCGADMRGENDAAD